MKDRDRVMFKKPHLNINFAKKIISIKKGVI
jgi:hypothetical protein